MNIFDLLFIGAFLTTIGALIIAAAHAIRTQWSRAGRILRRIAFAAGICFAIVIVVSAVTPRRVFHIGDPQCFDDWCIAVENVSRRSDGARVRYSVALRLSSRARRVAQRENNLGVYLVDDHGRRYAPPPGGDSAVPFNVLLQPGESVAAMREFDVPATARIPGLITIHEGGFPIGWFIIGYDTWFRKPAIVRFER